MINNRKYKMRNKIWMFVIFGLLVSSLSFSFQVISDSNQLNLNQNDEPDEEIGVGLASVSINGFIDDSPGSGVIGEWGDALSQNVGLTSESAGELPDFGVRYKVVSDRILIGLSLPANQISTNFEEIKVTYDMNGDSKLSQGDARINIKNGGVYYFEVFENGKFVDFEERSVGLKLNQQNSHTINVAQAAMKKTNQKIQIEIGLSRALFIKLVGLVPNDFIEGILGQVGFSIILIDGKGVPFGYPGIPQLISNANSGAQYYSVGTFHNFRFDLQVPDGFAVDVGITGIEFTQAVSSPEDNLAFVSNKPTLARVYIDNPTPLPLQVEVTLSLIDSVFLAGIFGYAILGTMTQTITIPSTTNRENFDHSANFLLPMNWTVQSLPKLISAEITPINFIDTDPANNDLYGSAFFQNFPRLNIYYIQVNEGNSSSPVLINNIDPTFIPQAFDDFQAMYPTVTPNFIELDWETLGVFDGTDDELISALNDIVGNLVLSILFQTIIGIPPEDMIPVPDQIFGFRTSGGGGSSPFWEGHASNLAAWGGLDAERGPMVFAHELNHNLLNQDAGKHVAGCSAPNPDPSWPTPSDQSIGAYWPDSLGWNSNTGELISSSTADLLSYCMGTSYPQSWISDYRWKELYQQLVYGVPTAVTIVSVGVRPALNTFGLELNQNLGTSRIISGIVKQDGSATLNPSYIVEGEFRLEMSNPSNSVVTHYLEIKYANNSIETLPIAPVYGNSGESLPLTSQNYPYNFWIPDNGEIEGLNLLDTNSNSVASLLGTGFSVTGTLTPPNPLLRGSDLQFTLDTTTINDTVLFTQLQYSPDAKVWINLGPLTKGILPSVQINKLPGGLSTYFRVRYTDGFDMFYLETANPAVLTNLPPTVQITNNKHNQPVNQETKLTLTKFSTLSLNAHAYDPEDGEIKDNNSYTWEIFDSNNQVVYLSSGRQIKHETLGVGTFEVVVTVKDQEGQSSSDNIIVEIISPTYITLTQYNKFVADLTTLRKSLITTSQSSEASSSTPAQSSTNSDKKSEKSDDAALDTISILFILPGLMLLSTRKSRRKN